MRGAQARALLEKYRYVVFEKTLEVVVVRVSSSRELGLGING